MDLITISEMMKKLTEYLLLLVGGGLSFGLLLGTALEFIGYGVFKALALLNIK